MEAHKVNYMMATWSGSRFLRKVNHHCLDKHLKHLNSISHSLSQITIGYPENLDESEEHKKFMSSLKELNDGTPIVVMPMINKGLSYGQWARMFSACQGFDYHIFIEDDYIPVIDGFDEILIDMFESEDCGFLCGLYASLGDQFGHGTCQNAHSAISNGISSTKILESICNNTGLHSNDLDVRQQVRFSEKFSENDLVIKDYISRYRCLYWPHKDSFRMYWDGKHNDDIIVPIQFLEEGKDWEFEKYVRKNGVMKKQKPKSASRPPRTVSAQASRADLQRAVLEQRRAGQRRGL